MEDQVFRDMAKSGFWAQEIPAGDGGGTLFRLNSAKDRDALIEWWNEDSDEPGMSFMVPCKVDDHHFDVRYLLACTKEDYYGGGVLSRKLQL